VFQDMIRRSVPGYGAIISAIGLLAGRFAVRDSRCYDLGCSLGAATLAMRRGITAEGCRIVAVDNSKAMTIRCREHVEKDGDGIPVDIVCADIRDVKIENASVVALNFTLQFIPLADRLPLLSAVYRGLLPGGVLILSEKIDFSDPRQQTLQTDMHHAFKKANGYSDLEISQKRTALENILLPETLEVHRKRLAHAGFSSTEVWFQYFNFISMIALR
ncbi:MAG: carboxy-S-adenosyl-L-methionine synthase CmoA, partial [Gammaproteobacteria bacterium]